ncbi:MAG: hypothetical protein HY458_01230 [Parcubacteria group bacterium]|nr:hypothetical protein [Parcubacteria group bacterium]
MTKQLSLFIILFAVFALWFSFFQTNALVQKFHRGASDPVIDALRYQADGSFESGGFLVAKDEQGLPKAYLSQYGLQFKIFALLWPPNVPLEQYVRGLYILLAFLFAATLAGFVLVVAKEFGRFSALFLAAGILSSPWLVLYSGGLAWMIFASFLPFVFSWMLYPYLKSKFPFFCFAIGFLIFFKALSGYEFLSNILLSTLVPVLYYELRNGTRLSAIARKSVWIYIAGFAGFLLALNLHMAQGIAYLGSKREILEHIVGKGLQRSFGEPLFAPRIVLDYLLGPAYLKAETGATLLITLAYLWTAGIFLLGILLLLFSAKKYREKFSGTQGGALVFALAFSYIAALSWTIVMPGDMVNHPQSHAIIFYLPANLMVFLFLPVFWRHIRGTRSIRK